MIPPTIRFEKCHLAVFLDEGIVFGLQGRQLCLSLAQLLGSAVALALRKSDMQFEGEGEGCNRCGMCDLE